MQESRAQLWIESVLNEKFPKPFEDALKDGIILCNLINVLKPGGKTLASGPVAVILTLAAKAGVRILS